MHKKGLINPNLTFLVQVIIIGGWMNLEERYNSECLQQSVKHGGGFAIF